MATGATKIKDPFLLAFALDHDIQNKSPSNLKKYDQIQEFAKNYGLGLYGAGPGRSATTYGKLLHVGFFLGTFSLLKNS